MLKINSRNNSLVTAIDLNSKIGLFPGNDMKIKFLK